MNFSSSHKIDDFEQDDEFDDNYEDALYSNDEGELDQSFDDSDLQNKDPGMRVLQMFENFHYNFTVCIAL